MKHSVKEAKCPYCKHPKRQTLGSDLQSLWGEYCSSEIKTKCESCGEEFLVSCEQQIIYKSKKLKV